MPYLDKAASVIETSSEGIMEFMGPAKAQTIAQAENDLEVKFPAAYREFLERYGQGSAGPFEIYGLKPGDDEPGEEGFDVVSQTSFARTGGLPFEFVVIYSLGNGEEYVLDCTQGDDPPILAWSEGIWDDTSRMEVVEPSFSAFLLDRAERASNGA